MKMKSYFTALAVLTALCSFSLSAAAAVETPAEGASCTVEEIGTTKLSSTHQHIVACLNNSYMNPSWHYGYGDRISGVQCTQADVK